MLSAQLRSIGCETSEEAVLLAELASDIPEITPKIDVLIADCEASSVLAMVSRSCEKICWACGQSDNRDPFEESQNPCNFC